jgi:hypothetical protein
MKTTHLSLTAAVWAAMSLLPALEAQEVMQTNDSQTDQATQPPSSPGAGGWKRLMANLTESERQQLRSAHDKATQQNPALEEAMKTAHQSMEKARKEMHDAMIAIDPAVAPILAKIEPPKWEGNRGNGQRPGKWEGAKEWKHHGPPPGMANLSEQERTQLKAAYVQIKDDPSFASAREVMKTATTPEARRTALQGLKQASDAALLKVDSTLGPILEKLHQAGPPPAPSSSASSNSPKDETMAPAQ